MMKKLSSAVLYHYPCPDGAFAALAAHLYFSATSLPVLYFPNTVYNPIKAEDLPLDDINDLYLLDFSGPSGFIQKISPRVGRVIILDHHKTALEMFREQSLFDDNVVKVIDIKRSGATIAYDYFKNKFIEQGIGREFVPQDKVEKVNKLFNYVEDGDLWRWNLPDSKAFSSGMKDLNIGFNVKSNPALFEQAVDADSIAELRSELGQQLANKSRNLTLRGIGAVVYKVPELENDRLLKISLRSIDTEDTTPISQEFGGGGHRNASSFMLSSADFDSWKVQDKAQR
ncbi:hypothetical protein GIB67_006050 [Kingdonia uniflora]|uniref:DHHA1 domain-containing protein n=1 Tax=Kingdonia uniflora TaxID=39325 RepID=A0A7J7LPS2_9MAGN|nr:hypothetical protein GIB67_006050 [Kingdonia uniflora]